MTDKLRLKAQYALMTDISNLIAEKYAGTMNVRHIVQVFAMMAGEFSHHSNEIITDEMIIHAVNEGRITMAQADKDVNKPKAN